MNFLVLFCYNINMRKIIMHIDINQFFAAATCLLEPELKGKPLIIASDSRRGIVSTASYEARKYGIHSAMPTFMAKQLCPNLIIRPGNYDYYQKKSHEFFSYIKEHYTSRIEQVSIDECYVDMSELMKNIDNPLKYLKSIQDELLNATGLGASIGLGPTKFLAKMASDYKKPLGITIIRKRDIKKYLYPLPIKDFWGIGKKTYPKLQDIGIYTIGDFATSTSPKVEKIMGKFYKTAKEWISGYGDDNVISERIDPKSISTSSTFLFDTNDYEEISKMLENKAKEVSIQAKKEHKVGKTITLILKDYTFKSITRSITLSRPTDDFVEIYNSVMNLFDKYFDNQLIRLAGVGLSSLINKDEVYVQVSLFDEDKDNKVYKTNVLINKLNEKANKKIFIQASKMKKG